MRTAIAIAALLCAAPVAAQDGAPLHVQGFDLPASNQLSPEAKAVLARVAAVKAPDFKGDIAKARAFFQTYNDDRLAEMRRHFRTSERETVIGGVRVHVVTPQGGVAPRNRGRVLVNIHGGAFMWGSGSGALVEAIPISATMGVEVVTVDYRLTPEHRYPAASEDVTAVYRALLKDHRAGSIGIYGCSAGGIITAQSTVWIRKQGLPRPGAIGTFCGTGAPYSGDSPHLVGPITGTAPMANGPLPDTLPTAYMTGVPASDTTAYPMTSQQEVASMPPTLLLAGSRDFAASALTLAHRRLSAAGVSSELQLFDGLPHAFFVWPDMPESIEAYRLIARFFDAHLEPAGKRGKARR